MTCRLSAQQSFRYLDVKWSGNLDVLTVTLYHCNLTAKTFYHRSIIGKLFLVFLVESLLCQTDVEGLGSLHHAVIAAQHILSASVLVDIAQSVGYGIYRDGCIFFASRLETFLDDFFRYEWAHAVVNTHYAIFIIRNECQSVFG